MGILIGITLAVTIGGGDSDVSVALWRGFDVSVGCVIAVLFCLIYSTRLYSLAYAHQQRAW
ncbi:hypothetical protein JCM19236_4549 [Vibrio sp. JCM 19236]|nr:hypothetical protein JCM19236_4549 [Vibrio sp. JCM 19236]